MYFAEFYAMPRIVVGDAAATLARLQFHQHLFAWALVAYFVLLLGDVVIAWRFMFC